MNQRRDLLKVMTLLPVAACTSRLRENEDNEPGGPRQVLLGWKPEGAELNLEEIHIKKLFNNQFYWTNF